MIANLLLSVSIAMLLIAVIDIFLSDSQKDKVSLSFAEAWNKLDDLSKLPYGALLENTKVLVISATITFLAGSLIGILLFPNIGAVLICFSMLLPMSYFSVYIYSDGNGYRVRERDIV